MSLSVHLNTEKKLNDKKSFLEIWLLKKKKIGLLWNYKEKIIILDNNNSSNDLNPDYVPDTGQAFNSYTCPWRR